MESNAIFQNRRGSFRRFCRMLWKAPLPFGWILLFIAASFLLTNIGVSATEYSARLYAGDVDAAGVVIPFLLVTLVSMLLGAVSGLISGVCSAFINRNLRRLVWRKAVRLPLSFYEANEPKELISRVTTDTTVVSNLTMKVFVPIITTSYSTFVLLRRVSTYDSALMLSLIVVLPVNVAINFILGRLNFGVNDQINKRNAELTAGIAERTGNMLLIKTMGTEEREQQKGEELMEKSYRSALVRLWITNFALPAHAIAGVLQTTIVILVGRGFYSAGSITLPEWIAYFGFASQLTAALSAYLNDWASFKTAQGATDRVSQIVEMPNEDIVSGQAVERLRGDIILDNVTFSYGEKSLFEGLKLTIPSGKITAIVGPSGSGKSTVLNLIDRLYPIRGGSIFIGSANTADFSLSDYRRAIGYVTQECVMYAGSLRENLLQGIDREVSDEELDAACEAAGIMDFVRSQGQGYALTVGESGASLSGGQRQRFTVARALLKRPDYLLLDEATAAMDIEGKDRVWKSIRSVMAGKTVLFVAHDAQTVRNADHLIVLRDGKVEASGDCDKILQTNAFCLDMMRRSGEEET